MKDARPLAYRFWPDFAQSRFDERVAIMRDGNNVADKAPTPQEIIEVARAEAESEIALMDHARKGRLLL